MLRPTRAALLTCFMLQAAVATAEASAPPPPEGPATSATVRQLLDLTGGGELGVQALDGILSQMRAALPQVPAVFWEEFRAQVSADELLALVVPIYSKHLTQADAEALVTFWSSPLGRRFAAKQPQIFQESMQAGQQWGMELAQKAMAKLKEKGYDVPE